MMTKKSTRLRTLCKQLVMIPLLAGLVVAFSTKTSSAQDLQSMSLTELMEAVSERMDTLNFLTDEEKEKLQNLVSKIQTKLQPKPLSPEKRIE